MNWLHESLTRYLFFTGKGGVGKTSTACALAVRLADDGKKVLLVSTDPASNLHSVLGVDVGAHPVAVPGVQGLEALNIDPETAAESYRQRVLAPMQGKVPEEEIAQVREQLSGSCTVEVAAFDEFSRFLADEDSPYDHVIFDTAPTGHTLRLLELPAAWSDYLDIHEAGASCLGPSASLKISKQVYEKSAAALRHAGLTTVVLVARPEAVSLAEADRTAAELADLGMTHLRLVLNGCFKAHTDDPLAISLEQRQTQALAAMSEGLKRLPTVRLPLRGRNIIGLDALRHFFDSEEPEAWPATSAKPALRRNVVSLDSIIDDVAAQGHGLVLLMGKGGVGKTTMAQALAVGLADRGHQVHLTTTDPAAHLDRSLQLNGLIRVSSIDPKQETERYIQETLKTRAKGKTPEERALIEEDLRSPCTEELAVFQAFAKRVWEARRGFVVLDTAPTGHTLMLLDTTGDYHRQMLRSTGGGHGGRVITPLMRLQDPAYTRLLIVALPETTPILEARSLQADLERAGIHPYGWIINQCLSPHEPYEPVLAMRAIEEVHRINELKEEEIARLALVPWQIHEAGGVEAARSILRSTRGKR